MRLVGLAIVRNEEDILEASLRHNLRALDAMVVVDHGSSDATPEILAALSAEGLAIETRADASIGFDEAALLTAHARRILASGADVCVPLDADQFLRVSSRAALDSALAVHPGRHRLARLVTACPSTGPGNAIARLSRVRRPAVERHGLGGVLVGKALLDDPSARISPGHHGVDPGQGGTAAAIDRLPESVIEIVHLPVRSTDQLTAKFAVGHLSRLLGGLAESAIAPHTRRGYAAVLAGRSADPAAVVANWGMPDDRLVAPDAVAWIEEELVDPRTPLLHTPDRSAAPLARILGFGERVAAEIAQTTRGL